MSIDPESLDSLDCILYLPGIMHGADLSFSEMYEKIVSKLRKESRGLVLDVVQQLVLERLASTYVMIRYRESIPVGEEGAFKHATEAKELNAFFMSLVAEWNKIIKGSAIETRQVVMRELLEITNKSLRSIQVNDEAKMMFVQKLEADLTSAGWTV